MRHARPARTAPTGLNLRQAGRYLGISPSTVKLYLQAGTLRGFQRGRVWRIPPAELDALMRARAT